MGPTRSAVVTGGVVLALVLGACSGDSSGSTAGTAAATSAAAPSSGVTTTPVGTCTPRRAVEPGTSSRSIVHDGAERTYELTVPEGYDGTRPAPLVLNLHGFAGTGSGQNAGTAMPERAGARGYIVVAPDGAPLTIVEGTDEAAQAAERGFEGVTFWNFFSGSESIEFGDGGVLPGDPSDVGADDVGFIDGLLDELTSQLCVDEARIYSTGMSNGAGMSTTLGCTIGDRLAAIAPVAGVNLTGVCDGDDPIPVLAIHGDADAVADFRGNGLFGFELGNPSVLDRMAQWAEHNGCATEPTRDEPVEGVQRSVWEDCVEGVDTELWVVRGMGHVWPNGPDADPPTPFEATEVVLDFFDAHRLDDRPA